MSAREELKRSVLVGITDDFVTYREAESAAEKLINDLLHEEAEKLRDKAKELARNRSYEMAQQAEGLRFGAELIDPYAS